MPDINDHWLWFVDSELVETMVGGDALEPGSGKRAVESAALAKAVALNGAGKTQAALDELARALAAGENTAELRWVMAHLEFQLGAIDAAAESYAALVALQPRHKAALYNAAICLERLGRHEEAAAAFERALEADPGFWEAQFGRAVSLLGLKRWEDALQAFERCLKTRPDHDRAAFGKGVALQMLSRCGEALHCYLALAPDALRNPDVLTNLIAAASGMQDGAKVREYAEKLLRARPQARPALEALLQSAVERGDFKSAIHYGTQLVESAPSAEAWLQLGAAYRGANRMEEAAQAYTEALQLRPEDERAQLSLAAALQERGDLAPARKLYEKTLETRPGSPAALWNLALLHERQGSLPEAEARLAQAAAASPGSDEVWFRLGYIRLLREDLPGSAAAFRKCLEIRPACVDAALNLAAAEWRAGNPEAAKGALEACQGTLEASQGTLEADAPPHAPPVELLEALAVVVVESGDYVAALEIEEKLHGLGQPTPELSYNIGVLLQRAELYEDAAQCYRRAAGDKPDFAEALLNLGHALKSLGQEREARSCWQQALEAKPALAAGYFEGPQA